MASSSVTSSSISSSISSSSSSSESGASSSHGFIVSYFFFYLFLYFLLFFLHFLLLNFFLDLLLNFFFNIFLFSIIICDRFSDCLSHRFHNHSRFGHSDHITSRNFLSDSFVDLFQDCFKLLLSRRSLPSLPLLFLIPYFLPMMFLSVCQILDMIQHKVLIDILQFLNTLHTIKPVKILLIHHLHPLRHGSVWILHQFISLIILHFLEKPPHILLSRLQLTPLFIHKVNPPKIIYLQFRIDVFFPVECDEWNFQKLLPHEVQSLLDLADSISLVLPNATVVPGVSRLLGQGGTDESELEDPLCLAIQFVAIIWNRGDRDLSKLHSFWYVGVSDFLILVCVVTLFQIVWVENVKNGFGWFTFLF